MTGTELNQHHFEYVLINAMLYFSTIDKFCKYVYI
jgi:hypothetical protein